MNSDDFNREYLYQVSVAIVRLMFKNHLITEEDFCRIDAGLIEKYNPLLGSLQAKCHIYSEGDCYAENQKN